MEQTEILGFPEDFEHRWKTNVLDVVEEKFGKQPNTDAILYLIGIQEFGQGPKAFSKEEKQDLIHIALCKILSYSGFYELIGLDEDGWPIWECIKKMPYLDTTQQENFLKIHILQYFELELNLT